MPAEHEENLEREKWRTEKSFRERELKLLQREQETKEAELALKRQERSASQWWSTPFMIASIAALGTALVALLNGYFARQVEAEHAEQTRILEMIKTSGDTEKAAANLQFLLDAGLVSDREIQTKLTTFLKQRQPGTGPSLPGGLVAKSLTALPRALVPPRLGAGATYTYSGIASPSKEIRVAVRSLDSDPPGKEVFVSMCARNDSNDCVSQQLGIGRSIAMQTPSDKEVTIVIFNFASNPAVTVNLGISYE